MAKKEKQKKQYDAKKHIRLHNVPFLFCRSRGSIYPVAVFRRRIGVEFQSGFDSRNRPGNTAYRTDDRERGAPETGSPAHRFDVRQPDSFFEGEL